MRAQFYAQFEQYKRGNTREARLIKASATRPRTIDGVFVKVTLEIPDGAFEPLEAQGVIEAGFVGIPIHVESGEIECANCGQIMEAGVEHICYDEEE